MKILFFGRLCEESIVWLQNLSSLNYSISFINTHQNYFDDEYYRNNLKIDKFDLFKNHKFPYGIKNLMELYLYDKRILNYSPGYLRTTKDLLQRYFCENSFDLIFTWWGSDVFYELYILLVELKLNIPVIHIINTYPAMPIRSVYGFFEDQFYKRFIDKIDGIVYYSGEMKNYFTNKIRSEEITSITIIDPPYSMKSYYQERITLKKNHVLDRQDDSPYLIFLGRTDFSNDFRRKKDNVKSELLNISKHKIHIFLRQTSSIKESDYIHFYPSFSSEELLNGYFATYVHQFDASLTIYNEFGNTRRYMNGLSTRFAYSLTAGIPIITRGSSIFAKKIFQKHNNGFTYSTIAELKRQLLNTDQLAKMKRSAEKNIDFFSFESYAEEFKCFLESVINKKT